MRIAMSKLWHRLKTYLRHDFREIVNPTSLPNPPEYVPAEKATWEQTRKEIQEANKQYWRTWQPTQEAQKSLDSGPENQDGSLKDELAQTTQAAMQRGQGLKPMLQHIYETRARSYRDAVQQFVEGYKEGYVGQPAAQPSSPKEHESDQEHTSGLSTKAAKTPLYSQQSKATQTSESSA